MLTQKQLAELQRIKQYYPYRVVFGVINKDTGEFQTWCKTTKHIANKLAREGHQVFILQ
jgi:hypothetical protein